MQMKNKTPHPTPGVPRRTPELIEVSAMGRPFRFTKANTVNWGSLWSLKITASFPSFKKKACLLVTGYFDVQPVRQGDDLRMDDYLNYI